MREVPARFLEAIGASHKRFHRVTVSPPGSAVESELDIDSGSFTISNGGARYSASLVLSPEIGADVFGMVSVPGAQFRIRSGIDYGAGEVDWVDCGVYEAISGNSPLTIGEIPLSLQDGTCRQERCKFIAPWTASAGTRASAIEAMVVDAAPDVSVTITADGGSMADAVYDRDRLAAERQIATDGILDAAFDAVGGFLIRSQPVITPGSPVWIARTGPSGNIVDADRDMPLGQLYNTVVVVPTDESQMWPVQIVTVADPDHPRHPDRIGVVPFFTSALSASTAAQAKAVGESILQQVLTSTEHINVTVIGNPALEYGDTVTVAHQRTETDPGYFQNVLLEQATFNLVTGAQQITGRSTSLSELEES